MFGFCFTCRRTELTLALWFLTLLAAIRKTINAALQQGRQAEAPSAP
jgi:hypothetical protein